MYDMNVKPRASVGTERTTTKKKPLDRLTRDVLAAEAVGMSYGQYKALHPRTGENDPNEILDHGLTTCTCAHCGGTFYKQPGSARKYCTEECRYKADRQRTAERKGKPTAKIKTCPICGKVFEAIGTAKYCGNDCYTVGNRANQAKLRERYRQEREATKGQPPKKTCPVCGDEFQGRGTAKYCCNDCYRAAQRVIQAERRKREREEAAKNGSV